MHTETPTFKLAVQVWWAQFWRTIPLVILSGVAIGVLVFIFQTIIGTDLPPLVSGVLGGAVGFVLAIKIIERLMTKGFGIYRLAVVKK